MPTQELKNFGATIEQADPLRELSESTRDAANVQKAFIDGVKDFPPDYFKNLADNTKAVSEMQMRLTESTMKLIDVQSEFAAALKNLPDVNPSRDISTNDGRLNDGFLKLSTQDLRRETDARLNQVSDIPPQKQIAQKDNGFKLGFDYDERLKAMPADVDLSEYFSVMPKISEDVQSILQSMQAAKEIPDNPALQQLQQMPEPNATLVDYLTPLNNIDGKLQSILQATQMRETISFETVITPLNSINALVGNILTALTNRQPPQITVAPNNSINLGGAYVFDNALKQELVNDITKRIVDEVTAAVKQATSQSSYNYGA